MSCISIVVSIITASFPGPRKQRVKPPPGLEGARVTYVSEGRSGMVIFSKGLKSFAMYYEFGGGDTLATIDVPSAREWEKETGFPLAARPAILEFIGRSVVREQTTLGTGRFELHDRYISIHA
jgi:hypothetical protein